MKTNLEKLGRLWFARTQESVVGTYQTSNLMSHAFTSSRLNLERHRTDNRDRMNGYEGATEIVELNRRTRGSVQLETANVDFITFILAYFFGSCTNTTIGSLTKVHTITPLSSIELPTLSGYQYHAREIFSEKFAGCGINSFDIEIGQGDWIKARCDIVGLGKSGVDYIKGTGNITNATTLTLNTYTPPTDERERGEGGDMSDVVWGIGVSDRLANIFKLEIQKADGAWYEATPTDCTYVPPAPSIITFTGISGLTGTEPFRIYYISCQSYDWRTPPTITQESPLKLANASLLVNGKYDGSAFIGGSSSINLHWDRLTLHGENGLVVRNQPGLGKIYGSNIRRQQRIVSVKLSKQLREAILCADIDANATMSLELTISGDLIETGHNYQVKCMFPLIGIVGLTVASNDKNLAEEGDLLILEDSTYGLGKIITKNKITTYLV